MKKAKQLRELLEKEGIACPGGIVDMKKYQWKKMVF